MGHGPPTRGGIPSFVTGLVEDEWLRARASIEYFNTCPRDVKQPGELSLANVWLTLRHSLVVLRRSRKSDVVHLNLAPLGILPLLRAMLMAAGAKLSGAAVVLHAHAGGLADVARHSRLYRAGVRLSAAMIDRVVVVSRDSERALSRLRGGVVFIANGVDLDALAPESDDAKAPVLIFAGTVCERKGLLDLRDALGLLRRDGSGSLPLQVKIVGDDAQEPGGLGRVKSAYASAGLGEVEFLGALTPSAVAALLRRASIFCLPSHREGLPFSLLEAMGAGCGIIASRVGDVPFALGDGDCGLLFEPHDVEALATAIKSLAEDSALRKDLGDRARFRAAQEFKLRNSVGRLFELYNELTASRRELRTDKSSSAA